MNDTCSDCSGDIDCKKEKAGRERGREGEGGREGGRGRERERGRERAIRGSKK